MDAPEDLAILGAASRAALAARLPLVASRARAAAALGKPLGVFLRESGRDWVRAPHRLRVRASSLEELASRLLAAAPLVAGREEAGELPVPGVAYETGPGPERPASPPRQEAVEEGLPADLEGQVRALAARLTGYAPEALAPHLDLARDLGLDSVKHAEVIESLWARCGVPLDEATTVADYPTLGRMVAFLEARGAVLGPPPEGPPRRMGPKALACPAPRPAPDPPGLAGLRDLVARETGEPPEAVRLRELGGGRWVATTLGAPYTGRTVTETREGGWRREGAPFLDPDLLRSYWIPRLGGANALVHVTEALARHFIREVRVEGPGPVPGVPHLYLTNHQTALESYLFPLLAPPLGGRPLNGVAMVDHGVDWADPMRTFMFSHEAIPPELRPPERSVRSDDPLGLARLVPLLRRDLAEGGWDLHVAAEGRRERTARVVLKTVSSAWIDLALDLDCPLVPVRFRGGLPLEDPGVAQDLPVGLGSQAILLGPPLMADALRPLSPPERKQRVLEALNRLGPPETEVPEPPKPDLTRAAEAWVRATGADPLAALILRCLERDRPLPGFEPTPGRHRLEAPTDALVAAARLAEALGRPVTLTLPDTADGRWLAPLARMAFGDRGPRLASTPGPPTAEA